MFDLVTNPSRVSSRLSVRPTTPTRDHWIAFPGSLVRIGVDGSVNCFERNNAPSKETHLVSFKSSDAGEITFDERTSQIVSSSNPALNFSPRIPQQFIFSEFSKLTHSTITGPGIDDTKEDSTLTKLLVGGTVVLLMAGIPYLAVRSSLNKTHNNTLKPTTPISEANPEKKSEEAPASSPTTPSKAEPATPTSTHSEPAAPSPTSTDSAPSPLIFSPTPWENGPSWFELLKIPEAPANKVGPVPPLELPTKDAAPDTAPPSNTVFPITPSPLAPILTDERAISTAPAPYHSEGLSVAIEPSFAEVIGFNDFCGPLQGDTLQSDTPISISLPEWANELFGVNELVTPPHCDSPIGISLPDWANTVPGFSPLSPPTLDMPPIPDSSRAPPFKAQQGFGKGSALP